MEAIQDKDDTTQNTDTIQISLQKRKEAIQKVLYLKKELEQNIDLIPNYIFKDIRKIYFLKQNDLDYISKKNQDNWADFILINRPIFRFGKTKIHFNYSIIDNIEENIKADTINIKDLNKHSKNEIEKLDLSSLLKLKDYIQKLEELLDKELSEVLQDGKKPELYA